MSLTRARFPQDVALPQRYRVERWIADGGMASVWCVRDGVLGRRVAIKLLAERFAGNDRAIRRFMREARTAAQLSSHPHVVAIHDVGEARAADGASRSGRPFIVMEYLAGGTVADALRVGAVSQELVIRWLRDAAAALDFAHASGVVHRDIKPGNLLLDRDHQLRVADFGIARLGSDDTITRPDTVLGTAAYISPEQARGKPATDASDRYSLAVVAYELLVGERPFAAEPAAAQALQHVEQEPPRASRRNHTLPRAVDAVLARGMAKDPGDRFPAAAQFAGALEQATLGRFAKRHWTPAATAVAPAPRPVGRGRRAAVPVRARRPPEPAPVRVPASNRRARTVVLASLAAAAFVVGVAAGAGRDRTVKHAPAAASHVLGVIAHGTAVRHHHNGTKRRRHTQPVQTVAAAPAAATTSAPTAQTLEARGHQLMVDGNYSAAIPVLRDAVNAADPGSLTYAYALFDLGRSLRLSGDPRAAIPILYRRLQIPDATDVVRQELQLALRAIGLQEMHTGGASPAQPPNPGDHGHGPGHGGQGGPPPWAGGGNQGD